MRALLSGCDDGFVSSSLLAVELRRAALRAKDPAAALAAVATVIPAIHLIRVDDEVIGHAGILMPPSLRSLDAIHLATVLLLGSAVEAMVCYDSRLISAAVDAGINVKSPT